MKDLLLKKNLERVGTPAVVKAHYINKTDEEKSEFLDVDVTKIHGNIHKSKIGEIRAKTLMDLKRILPERMSGEQIKKKLDKLELKVNDFCFLTNKNYNTMRNCLSPKNVNYHQKRDADGDLMLELAVRCIELTIEKQNQINEQLREKQAEKIYEETGCTSALQLAQDRQAVLDISNTAKIIDILQNEKTPSINVISEKTGLTKNQIIRLRESVPAIKQEFKIKEESYLQDIKENLYEIMEGNKDDEPLTAIAAAGKLAQITKSDWKDKETQSIQASMQPIQVNNFISEIKRNEVKEVTTIDAEY